jgi:uncharacterized protein (TIGR02001 family)
VGWLLASHATLLGVLMLGLGAPADAQVAGSIAVQSDDQLRGYSLSAGKPAATVDLSYDNPIGVYANALMIGDLNYQNDPALLAVVGNVGYAHRLTPEVSVDGGVSQSQYYQRYGLRFSSHYTETYVGIVSHFVSSHIYYSPNYFEPGTSTIYAEIDGAVTPIDKLRVTAHLGVLSYLHSPAVLPRPSSQYDWRLGVSRAFGPFELNAHLSGGGPGPDYYGGRTHDKTRLSAGASWTF